jgi:hypothetical protein
MNEVAVVVGYIMYYKMLEEKLNGSFFTQIDKAIEIAELFCNTYTEEEKEGWVNKDFEETLEEFLNKNI